MGTPFHEWVNSFGGSVKLAKALGVKPHTVRVWMRRQGIPRPATILKLITLSKGALTFDVIIKSTAAAGTRLRKGVQHG